jgi:hypothetical protein
MLGEDEEAAVRPEQASFLVVKVFFGQGDVPRGFL